MPPPLGPHRERRGCRDILRPLVSLVQNRQLSNVAIAAAGCLGFCHVGPLMVVYPQGVWYQPKTVDDIGRILQSHFVEGQIVEDLSIVPHL